MAARYTYDGENEPNVGIKVKTLTFKDKITRCKNSAYDCKNHTGPKTALNIVIFSQGKNSIGNCRNHTGENQKCGV